MLPDQHNWGSCANHVHRRHALATLEVGNLSCIPVHKGADYPLLNTPELFQTVSQKRQITYTTLGTIVVWCVNIYGSILDEACKFGSRRWRELAGPRLSHVVPRVVYGMDRI